MDQFQFSNSYERGSSSCEAPALLKRLQAVETNRLLRVIGQALFPFGV